jgi:hypothetical protein
MGWDAAIHGRLVIPSDQRDAWLATTLDWASVPGHEAWDGHVEGPTVRDAVEGGYVTEDGLEFLEFEWQGDELRVAAFMAKDGFIDHVLGIAAAWAASAPFGGRGQLIGMGMLTASFGYRLRVGEGQAKFEKVRESEVDELDDHPDAEAIEARVTAASEALLAEFGESEDDEDDEDVPAKPAAKKTPAKKTTAKKTTAKKTTAKKTTAKKTSAKQTPAKQTPAKQTTAKKKPTRR